MQRRPLEKTAVSQESRIRAALCFLIARVRD